MAIVCNRLCEIEGQPVGSMNTTLSGRERYDYYEVAGINSPDDMDGCWAAGLPKPGQSPHNDDTIVKRCNKIKTIGSIAPFLLLFEVYSRANYQTPQYRRGSSLELLEPDRKFEIPNWTRIDDSPYGTTWFRNTPIGLDGGRLQYRRVDVRVATGVTPEDVQAFDARNFGTWTVFDETIYKYLGTEGRFGNDGFSLLTSYYETSARVKAFPIGIIPGWDVAIPALPNKAYYHINDANKSLPPVVSVVRLQDQTDPMEQIPW